MLNKFDIIFYEKYSEQEIRLSDGSKCWRPFFEELGTLQNKLYHSIKLKDE